MPRERLQKILAAAGTASRRGAEELILAGRVRVNGRRVTELGAKADPHKDRIEVDGRRLVREKPVYYILHKPRGVVSTLSDPQGRETVRDLLKRVPERVFPVGRLDYHTSGALLLTNDGEMSDALLRPRANVPKVYAVKFQGHLPEEALQALRQGVELDDGTRTRPADVFVLREEPRHTWCQITLTEGKTRQIHRMGEAIGHRVMRLARTSFAGITTDDLRPGHYRPLGTKELDKLKRRYLKPKRRAEDKGSAAAGAEWTEEAERPRPRRSGRAGAGSRGKTPGRGKARGAGGGRASGTVGGEPSRARRDEASDDRRRKKPSASSGHPGTTDRRKPSASDRRKSSGAGRGKPSGTFRAESSGRPSGSSRGKAGGAARQGRGRARSRGAQGRGSKND